MRENAAMHGGADKRGAPLSSLVLAAAAAGMVLLVALLVRGGETGTIVVQRVTLNVATTTHGRTTHPPPFSVLSINETSADGIEQRSLTGSSFTRAGFEQVIHGDTVELYDPLDDTVYVTTLRAEQRAMVEQLRNSAPKGSHVQVGVGRVQLVSASANSIGYVPGRVSSYEEWLRDGSYKLVGRVTVDGRRALKLVEASPTRGPTTSGGAAFESRTTVYVAPRSFEPIQTVNRARFPGVATTSVTRWTEYRALPATAANQRLLSLTARHPGARVVRNATAYLRAGQDEAQPMHIPTGTTTSGDSGATGSAQSTQSWTVSQSGG